VLDGHPDAVARPQSEAEVADLLTEAAAHAIPVTAAGGRTSVTGSSVAEEGLVIAMERMDRILELKKDPETGGMTATAEPGIFLGDFQRAMEAEGWYYPPDPTSRNEAQLGATVATNATGEDTLQYGPTRRWVRELRVVQAGGSVRTLRRSQASRPPEEKATAGYYLDGEEIDLLIGSEGTLAVITGVTVDLIPLPGGLFAGLAFFPSLRSALSFVVRARQHPLLRPRALELMDGRALLLVDGNPEGIRPPAATGGAVVFKQEFADENERDRYLEAWFTLLETHLREAGAPSLAEVVTLFETGTDLLRLRSFRHRIPLAVAETLAARKALGVGKVATDWWVPYERLPDFLDRWIATIRAAGLDVLAFGHVGNGHPHVNFLPRTGEEAERARAMVVTMCREAVALGGGVAGEHGLGKLKRHLLAVQCRPERIAAMRAMKRTWDPSGILGRGNLFPEESV
jgi:FAD/FMN-containing dehydrogenase